MSEICIYLTSEEIHWLRYSILTTIAELPPGDLEKKQLYVSILNKLSASQGEELNPSTN
jgi:hypothetical protein